MEFALILRELWSRKRVLAIGAVVAFLVALASVVRLPSLQPRPVTYASASTQLLVDTPQSSLADLAQNIDPLQARATVLANLMASPAFLDLVGRQVGLSGSQIYAAGPVDPMLPRTQQEPTDLKRNVQLTGETAPYRLNFNSDPNVPEIGVYTQAPTVKMAVGLANATAVALRQYIATADNTGVPSRSRATIRQLGQANGAVVNGGVSKQIFVLVFVGVMFFWCIMMLVSLRWRANWRASAGMSRLSPSPAPVEEPVTPEPQPDDYSVDWYGPVMPPSSPLHSPSAIASEAEAEAEAEEPQWDAAPVEPEPEPETVRSGRSGHSGRSKASGRSSGSGRSRLLNR